MTVFFRNRKKNNLIRDLEKQLKEKERVANRLEKIKELLREKEELIAQLEIEKAELEEKLDERLYPILQNTIFKAVVKDYLEQLKKLKELYSDRIKGARSKIIIFSNRDPDGICCAAILKRYFGKVQELKTFFIRQYQRYLIYTVEPSEELITADLVLDDELARYFLKLKEQGIKVTAIDHHKETSELSENLLELLKKSGVLVFDLNASSAAELVCKRYGLSDGTSQQLKSIANKCDNKRSLPLEWRNIRKVGSMHGFDVETIVEELVEYGYFRDEVRKKLQEKANAISLATAYSEDSIKTTCVADTEDFQVFDTRKCNIPIIGARRAVNRMVFKTEKDIYVIGSKWVIGTVKKRKANEIFGKLANEIGGKSYARECRGGCLFLDMQVETEEIVRYLRELYRQSLSKPKCQLLRPNKRSL